MGCTRSADWEKLILKRASPSRPSGEWNNHDFDVLADGVLVGRILLEVDPKGALPTTPQFRGSQPEPLDRSGVVSLSRSHDLTGVAIHAGQQETNMAATDRFEIPPEMRALAEKSVEQARQAFDSFISAAHRAVSAFEGQAETARRGAKDVTENAMTFAQQNIASSFELAEQLVRARDVEEVLKLQADYIKRQMQLFGEQARELGERTSATAKDATTPNQG